jgi:hypothetical protein
MAELVVAVLVLGWLVAVLGNVVAGSGGGDGVAVVEVLGKVGLAGGDDDDDVAIAEVLGNAVVAGRDDVGGGGGGGGGDGDDDDDDGDATGVDEAGDMQAASQ